MLQETINEAPEHNSSDSSLHSLADAPEKSNHSQQVVPNVHDKPINVVKKHSTNLHQKYRGTNLRQELRMLKQNGHPHQSDHENSSNSLAEAPRNLLS